MCPPIEIGCSSVALGDTLCLTPLCFARKTLVNLTPFHAPRLASLFDGIAEVKISGRVLPYNATKERNQFAQRILNYYNVSEVNCIPKILIFEKELEEARKILSKYKNPIIFNNYSVILKDSEKSAKHRRLPSEHEKAVLAILVKQEYDILRFRWKPEAADERINMIIGLDLRVQAACYSLINKYIGIDSGDYYLMLAAGGKAIIFVNNTDNSIPYYQEDWLFLKNLWKNEKVRVKYLKFNDFRAVENGFDF